MNALLEFGENFLDISVEPPETIFVFDVKSNGFTGCGECEVDEEDISRFVSELEEMYRLERDNAKLQSVFGYESRVEFIMRKTGHVIVCGKASCLKHSVEFEFEADQTVLPSFIKRLREMLNTIEESDIWTHGLNSVKITLK